jgi:radical SAM protein with 4Fe4S-binding SPASM domain
MCPITFRTDGPPHGPLAFMPFESFTQLLDQFGPLQELHLQGLGEPLMHPRFFDMVRYATEKGIRVSTNSNLTLLTAQRAERCVTSGLEWLHISLDGATPETDERIRVRSRFERVLRNLELLMQARARLGVVRPHVRLVVVVMRQNLHELPALVRLAHSWSIDTIFVQHLCHDFGESTLPAQYRPMREFIQAQTLLAEDPQRVTQSFAEARQVAQELGVDLRLPRTQPRVHPPQTPGPQRCDWPWRGAYISYQGQAMPCCMVATPDRITFGNMAKDGVAAVWNNAAYETFRNRLASEQPPEVCRSCAVYNGTF